VSGYAGRAHGCMGRAALHGHQKSGSSSAVSLISPMRLSFTYKHITPEAMAFMHYCPLIADPAVGLHVAYTRHHKSNNHQRKKRQAYEYEYDTRGAWVLSNSFHSARGRSCSFAWEHSFALPRTVVNRELSHVSNGSCSNLWHAEPPSALDRTVVVSVLMFGYNLVNSMLIANHFFTSKELENISNKVQ
jgi:hypothetical protein